MESSRATLDMDAPAIYEIRVQGKIDLDWSDRLGGMQILVSQGGRGAHSQLVGQLPDQAALLGVVNSLFNLGFPILEVNVLSVH